MASAVMKMFVGEEWIQDSSNRRQNLIPFHRKTQYSFPPELFNCEARGKVTEMSAASKGSLQVEKEGQL